MASPLCATGPVDGEKPTGGLVSSSVVGYASSAMQAPSDSPLATRIGRVLSRFPSVRVAVLFGSQAKGTARPDSDVDVGIDGSGVDTLEVAAALMDDLGLEVHVVPLDQASIPLLDEIAHHGIVVYEAKPGSGASFWSKTLATLETDRPWYARWRDAWLARQQEEELPHG